MPFLAKELQNGYREKVYLATKLSSWLVVSRTDMDKFMDEQLERLDTQHINFLNDAIKSGKIGYAGFSFHDEFALFKEIIDAYD